MCMGGAKLDGFGQESDNILKNKKLSVRIFPGNGLPRGDLEPVDHVNFAQPGSFYFVTSVSVGGQPSGWPTSSPRGGCESRGRRRPSPGQRYRRSAGSRLGRR